MTVTWPTAITQPKGRPVKYELTLWDRADCPKGGAPCNGHAYIPVPACDGSKTECAVVFSTTGRPSPNAPPLTADTLKSMSVVAKDPDGHIAHKEANFTARLAPPPDLGPIRQELRQDIREDRQELKQLKKIDVPHERSIRRWLRVQLRVLKARRTYPTDEVLKQIDESMGSEPTRLPKAEKQRILARLNARLAELQGGT